MPDVPVADLTLEVRHFIRAPRAAVFHAWTMASSVREWLSTPGAPVTSAKIDNHAGGRITVECAVPGGTWKLDGAIRELVEPAVFEFAWATTDCPAEVGSVVRVEFHEHPGGTDIVLMQRGFPTGSKLEDNRQGWTELLPKIEAHIAVQPSLRAEVRRTIQATPDVLYRAWTTPEQAAVFLSAPGHPATMNADVRVGGRFDILMASEKGERYPHTGEYLELDPPRRLAFTWISAWSPAELGAKVTVTFRDQGDGSTEVVLVHERFTDTLSRDDHQHGWAEFLGQLAAFAKVGFAVAGFVKAAAEMKKAGF